MSDDLISKRALFEKLVELEDLARQRVIDTPTSSPCYQRYVAQLNERTNLKHMVFDAPTAYDVDKVVEQINSISVEREDYSESVECNIDERGCIPSCYDCIINHVEMIVKAGGVK